MTTDDYRTLYRLLRQFQVEDASSNRKLYNACDVVLRELFPYYYDQIREQER